MALLSSLVGKIIGLAILLVVVVVVLAVGAYAVDYGVEATVTDTNCGASPPSVEVRTKLLGTAHQVPVSPNQCLAIQRGNFVVYHVRSERATIYEREGGRCIYDSVTTSCPT